MNSLEYLFFIQSVGQGFFYTGRISDFYMVYDCGADKRNLRNLESEIEIYKNHGNRTKKIDLLIISHFDFDHVSGLKILLSNFKIHTIVIPYIPFAKRIELLLKNYRADQWYFDFVNEPIRYLESNNDSSIIVLAGSKGNPDNGLPTPEPSDDLPPTLTTDDFHVKHSESKGDESIVLQNKICRKDHSYIGSKVTYAYANRIKGFLSNVWKFCFYYLAPNERIYKDFKRKFKKLRIKTSNDLAKHLSSSSGRKSVRDCYPSDSKKMNNTSIVVYHSPINNYFAQTAFLNIPASNQNYEYIHNPFFNRIQHNRNIDFGQLLTGDLDLNEKSSDFFKYFKNEITDVACFYSIRSVNPSFFPPGIE